MKEQYASECCESTGGSRRRPRAKSEDSILFCQYRGTVPQRLRSPGRHQPRGGDRAGFSIYSRPGSRRLFPLDLRRDQLPPSPDKLRPAAPQKQNWKSSRWDEEQGQKVKYINRWLRRRASENLCLLNRFTPNPRRPPAEMLQDINSRILSAEFPAPAQLKLAQGHSRVSGW